jgi:hypothetical protein
VHAAQPSAAVVEAHLAGQVQQCLRRYDLAIQAEDLVALEGCLHPQGPLLAQLQQVGEVFSTSDQRQETGAARILAVDPVDGLIVCRAPCAVVIARGGSTQVALSLDVLYTLRPHQGVLTLADRQVLAAQRSVVAGPGLSATASVARLLPTDSTSAASAVDGWQPALLGRLTAADRDAVSQALAGRPHDPRLVIGAVLAVLAVRDGSARTAAQQAQLCDPARYQDPRVAAGAALGIAAITGHKEP